MAQLDETAALSVPVFAAAPSRASVPGSDLRRPLAGFWHWARSATRFWASGAGLLCVTLPVVAVTALHYALPAAQSFDLLHNILRRLYYVPILGAGVLAGRRAGLLTALTVSVLYLPHVMDRWGDLPTQRWDALFEVLLYNGIGALTGWLADAVKQHQEAMLRADRLATLGTMAAGMAHEVRNPLAAVQAAAEKLRDGVRAEEDRRVLLDIVGKETARLEGVVRDFLGFARPAPLVRLLTDLRLVAQETIALAQAAARPRSITITVSAAEAVTVRGDPFRLKQALLNLLLNAVAAAPPASQVMVSVRRGWRGVAEVAVVDRGPGLPAEIRRNLFVPFTTGREGGTGLGLPVARQIAEAHGGEVELRDALLGGTEAVLRIPGGSDD